jgi:predicted ATP-grasp superfamily ATP-dependent carboligase
MFPIIRSRGEMLRVASELGIRVPETRSVRSEEDLDSRCVDTSAVLKLDGTWAGIGVEIVHSRDEALAAYRRLLKFERAGAAWQRLLFHRDASALWSGQGSERRSITIQQFISGRPANAMLACWRGQVLSMVMVEVVCAHGATGISTVVRLIQNAEIAEAARLLARRFELTGFYGLDFMLEQGSGAAYLIELNARCTQLGHLCIAGQGDLAGVLVARLKGEPAPVENDAISSDTIAFFPQAFRLNPQSAYLREGYHDVPWQEPRLFRELLRDSWPHRQWPARLYRIFRPAESCVEMNFDRAMVEDLISQVALTSVGNAED